MSFDRSYVIFICLRIFLKIPYWFPLWCYCCSRLCCFVFAYLQMFSLSLSLFLVSSFIPMCLKRYTAWFLSPKICFLTKHVISFQRLFHVDLRKMRLLLLSVMFHMYLLGSFSLQCCLSLLFLYRICLDILSIIENGLSKSTLSIVLLSISPNQSCGYLIYFFRSSDGGCLCLQLFYVRAELTFLFLYLPLLQDTVKTKSQLFFLLSFGFYLHEISFSMHLILFVSFNLKWVIYRQ